MREILSGFLESGFMPHAHCFFWRPDILWLHVISDGLIAAAYFSIPLVLITVVRRRDDIAFSGVILLFAAFILACGATHALSIVTMWEPIYRIEGVVKLTTAGVSVFTAAVLWPLLPRILTIPNPAELNRTNEALSNEMSERRAAEQRFRSLLEAAPDAMIIVDFSGEIVLANDHAETLFQYSREQLVGQPIELLVPEGLKQMHVRHRTEYTRDPRRRPMGASRDLHAVRRDGSRLPVEISLSPLETGEERLVISAIRDITERRQNERRLQELNDLLSKRVDERTLELEERAAELARSNAQLDQFASVISHDLKSPMRGIVQLTDWLVEDHGESLGQEGRHHLELLRQRASRMHHLIEGVLDYSRATSRGSEPRPVAIGEVVHEVIDALAPPSHVDFEIADPLPTVVYDPIRLSQVFQNLISNSIAHHRGPSGAQGTEDPGDGSRLRIGIRCEERGEAWEVQVSDDGPGIPVEHQERVFGIFQTLATEPSAQRSGVGLSICKNIVEANGGAIFIDETYRSGTRVCFTIPRRDVPPPE